MQEEHAFIYTKCMKMGYNKIYQASNTCVFVLVESVCTALIPAPQASFMVQFPVAAWGLHRDGIIMVSCGAFYGVYMMSAVSIMHVLVSIKK